MFCLAINQLAIMYTEIHGFDMFDIVHFLGFISYKIEIFEKGYFKFLSFFTLMFGIWLHCIIFVFINLKKKLLYVFKKGVYLFPLK